MLVFIPSYLIKSTRYEKKHEGRFSTNQVLRDDLKKKSTTLEDPKEKKQ